MSLVLGAMVIQRCLVAVLGALIALTCVLMVCQPDLIPPKKPLLLGGERPVDRPTVASALSIGGAVTVLLLRRLGESWARADISCR